MQEITEIAELKEIQLGILRKVDELCKAHHLKYFMSDGTLLGAVRHKGIFRGMMTLIYGCQEKTMKNWSRL